MSATQLKYETTEEMVEFRSGRNLFYRKTVTTFPTSTRSSPDQNKKHRLNILFVHGSCAASSQYDSLVTELGNMIHTSENIGTTPPSTSMNDTGVGAGVGGTCSVDSMHCHLYDQLGCARSKHPSNDWDAFSSDEHHLDLKCIAQSFLQSDKDENNTSGSPAAKFYIVAHSYGVSQTIKLVNSLPASDAARINGLILIGGAVKGGPGSLAKDGGHWIFSRYVPMTVLRMMQPSMSRIFAEAAIHPSNMEKMVESGCTDVSKGNDMAMCKAFYRQQEYATEEEASMIKVKSLVVHGADDKIFPLSEAESLYEALGNPYQITAIPEASHQVFEERPHVVAETMINFIFSQTSGTF
jgi:pimeloyl-ACP methyl ester carboxylesterase